MHRIVLLGSPGAGKGTQAQMLVEALGVTHISTGDLLRAELRNQSELGLQAKAFMDQGSLVPDALMIQLVKQRLCDKDCQEGYLLDGFPRTLAQAQALRESGINIDSVIEIDVSDHCVIERLSGRRVHPASGRTYHVRYNPPKVDDHDDLTGEPLIQRADDSPETIKKRLDVYHSQTTPLIDYYQAWAHSTEPDAPSIFRVDGAQSPKDVSNTVLKYLNSL